jgi:VanZ family protein
MKFFLQRYGLAIAWAILLFALSSIPDLAFPVKAFSWDDKILHAAVYAPLGFLLLRAIVGKGACTRKELCWAIIIGTLYGVSDEIHQYFVPGRFMDWTDAAADSLGVMFGSWIFYKWRQQRFARRQQTSAGAKRKNFVAS